MKLCQTFCRQILFNKCKYKFSSESFDTENIIDIGLTNRLKGGLTVCPTPIGNLKDISMRQYEALLEADIIACEDTRITGKLLELIKSKKINEILNENFGSKYSGIEEEILDEKDNNDESYLFIPSKEEKMNAYKQQLDMEREQRMKDMKDKGQKILDDLDSLSGLKNGNQIYITRHQSIISFATQQPR